MSWALSSLLAFFTPLASEVHEEADAVTLRTPDTNILALNATYCFGPCPAPPHSRLLAGTEARPGRDVGGVRVGVYDPQSQPHDHDPGIVVEQVARLHLAAWAGVLAEAYDTPEWASSLARHLGGKLEGDNKSVLLMAYEGKEAVGALLWREQMAHLWGTLDERADLPLLNAAAGLSAAPLLVSVPDQSRVVVPGAEVVTFTLSGP